MQTRPLPRWLAALFLIALCTAAACSSSSSPTQIPTATQDDPITTPTPTPDGSSPTAAPGGQPGEISPELAEFLRDVDRRVSNIRGIPVAEQVPYRFLNREEINAYVRAQIDEPEIREDIEISEGLYKLLGLIPAHSDLFDDYSALLDAQVLGVYDPEVEEFVVLQPGGEFGPSQEFTYAHEYVHRLQDAKFGLDTITDSLEENSDRSIAFTALVEGDASVAQQNYALQHMSIGQLTQILEESQQAAGATGNTPYILIRGLEFPYVEGATFAANILDRNGNAGLDETFLDPPDSSEQILHFDKFEADEQPHAVTLPEGVLNDESWEQLDEDVLGEFFLQAWLEALGAGRGDAAEAAAGWGGDLVRIAQNSDDDYALTGKITWDNPELDAQQFSIVLKAVLDASSDFEPLDIGPDIGVSAYQGPSGVFVVATFSSENEGLFTAFSVAPEHNDAMSLVLALAG